MDVRLFVAVYPSPAALGALAAELPPLPAPWRAVAPEQWHLTLAFLGEVPPNRITELTSRLDRAAARTHPPAIALAGLGAFPCARRARVLWAGVHGDRDALTRLAERVNAAARGSGVPTEARGYRPHLTLAHARQPGGTDAGDLLAAMRGYTGRLEPVAEIVLVHSTLGAAVRHERIGTWELRGCDRPGYQA